MNVTTFRQNIFSILNRLQETNEPFTVTTKKGNIICLSENTYKNIEETMYLLANPVMNKEILEGLATPEEECVSLEDVEW